MFIGGCALTSQRFRTPAGGMPGDGCQSLPTYLGQWAQPVDDCNIQCKLRDALSHVHSSGGQPFQLTTILNVSSPAPRRASVKTDIAIHGIDLAYSSLIRKKTSGKPLTPARSVSQPFSPATNSQHNSGAISAVSPELPGLPCQYFGGRRTALGDNCMRLILAPLAADDLTAIWLGIADDC